MTYYGGTQNISVAYLTWYGVKNPETSLKWLTVAMPFLKIRERLARDWRETRERNRAMADGLTSTNKREMKLSQMA